LACAGVKPVPVSTLDELQAQLTDTPTPLAMLVLGLGSDTSLLDDALLLLKSAQSTLPVVCRLERRHLEVAVSALQAGACHALVADDWSPKAWDLAASRAAAHTPKSAASAQPAEAAAPMAPIRHAQHSRDDAAVRSVVYVDPISRNLLALAQRVALAPVAVLIEGPTGSGKEVLSRVLHESSPASHGPFIGMNCAAMPDHMIEDMLFCHEK
jgi:two-component system response regulator FlrC